MAGIGPGHGFCGKNGSGSATDVMAIGDYQRVFYAGTDDPPQDCEADQRVAIECFAKNSPVAYVLAVLLVYCVVAGVLKVSLVFAAFLAGFAVVHRNHRMFSDALDAIAKVSFAFFIPVYFAIVGLKLDLLRGLSLWMIAAFLIGSSLVKITSVTLAGRIAGFRGLDLINLAVTTNARGGPGIVLASVAFDAGIISAKFYTTLILAAVLTSQFTGAWLDYVLRKGWPLLTATVPEKAIRPASDIPLAT